MQNATINYTILLLQGHARGKEVELSVQLDEIEDGFMCIGEYLIDKGYFDGYGHPPDAYTVVSRNISVFDESE